MSSMFKTALAASLVGGALLVWIGAAHAVPLSAPTKVRWMDSLDNGFKGGALVWTVFHGDLGYFPLPADRRYTDWTRYGGLSVWGSDVSQHLWKHLGTQDAFDNIETDQWHPGYGLFFLKLTQPVLDCGADVDVWLLPDHCRVNNTSKTPVSVSEPPLFGLLWRLF